MNQFVANATTTATSMKNSISSISSRSTASSSLKYSPSYMSILILLNHFLQLPSSWIRGSWRKSSSSIWRSRRTRTRRSNRLTMYRSYWPKQLYATVSFWIARLTKENPSLLNWWTANSLSRISIKLYSTIWSSSILRRQKQRNS